MTAPGLRVVVHPDATTLAHAVAARLLTRLIDLQSDHSPVHVALTGGTIGNATLAAVRDSPVRDAVDWTGVHLWWGDERYLADGDAERNETQARGALLDALGSALPAGNVHPVPAPGSPGVASPEDAATAYAAELAAQRVSGFDLVMLGMGPDGHVASLFPGHRALEVAGTTTVGVHGSPKPPPERVSLTFDAIRAADEVWLVVAGAEKASKVAAALTGAPVAEVPAVGATGRLATLWLIDAAASAEIPVPGSPAPES